MDVSGVPATTMAMASASQQLQATAAVQVSMLQEIADSQQQIAQMLADSGLAQQIDVRV